MDKYYFKDKQQSIFIGAVVIGILAVTSAVMSLTRIAQQEQPAAKSEVTVAVDLAENIRTIDGRIDALIRSWNITAACYDAKSKSYLVSIPETIHITGHYDYDKGWYMISEYDFTELQNQTFVVKRIGAMVKITPDVTGLQCKLKIWNQQ